MARINYYQIELDLKDILDRAEELTTTNRAVTVLVEEDLAFQRGDIVLIELDRRDAPDDQQTLSAGKRHRYELQISVWCYGFGLRRADAMRNRDDLLSRVEIVLQNNREFGQVGSSWFTGGQFQNRSNESEDAFLSGAEIELVCDVAAVSP